MFYNDLSSYRSENILTASPKPAHSGPELMPTNAQAIDLARELVLDKISLICSERPATTTTLAERSYKVRF